MLPKQEKCVGRHAMLPETLDLVLVGDLLPGDVRYARTCAMRATKDRLLWLDSTHPTSLAPDKDMPMMVTRTEEGYCVDVTDIKGAAWGLDDGERFDDNYGSDVEWLPVAHLIDFRERIESIHQTPEVFETEYYI